MDEGDIEFSNPEIFPGANVGSDPPSSCSMDSFFEEIFKDSPSQHQHACTHTHTCNPPGRDLSHTHTCFHVHTKILSASQDEIAESTDKSGSTKKRPVGNREAVRKYREKKKAHAASLEDEVVHLRALNEQLMRKLQNQAALEAEVARLRCLLVDIRGRIEGEIGTFPYHRPIKGSAGVVPDANQANAYGRGQVINSCDFQCNDQLYCSNPGAQWRAAGANVPLNSQAYIGCEAAEVQCMGRTTSGSKLDGCGGNVEPLGCSSNPEQN